MARVAGLVGELRQQLKKLEVDLRARVDGDDEYARQSGVFERWHAEWEAALKAERTAASWQAWRDERATQAAVGWVLLTVFARFCEDNELVEPVWIAGHTRERRQIALDARREYFQFNREDNDRHWLSQIVTHFAAMGATAGLVDEHSPLHQVAPSGDAARQLLEFWWETDSEGELLRKFSDPDLDTRFLGDLYQDLSDEARDKYALLQTPEFVEEFILDQTMEPALAERPLEGFTLIDPTCGSGHFLLGAFSRLLDRWSKHAPNLEPRALVQNALDGVHGVDINPFAVAIARFRLIVAALKATDELSLERAPAFHTNLANGDSLLFGGRQQGLGDDLFSIDENVFAYSVEDRKALERLLQVRDGEPVGYDVVIGNPPYITPKDKALNAAYRKLYKTCYMKYALTIPFMELFFALAHCGDRPGWVGQITSNSFMKREFGKPLIEEFLAHKDLRAVIDTSGVPVPGHGTATLIMVGRNSAPANSHVRAVLSVRGEPPVNRQAPECGFVWPSIVNHLGAPGFEDGWITVVDLDRQLLARHPWSLSGGGAVELAQVVEETTMPLGDRTTATGFVCITAEDGAFFLPSESSARTHGAEAVRLMVEGDGVRDYSIARSTWSVWPYDEHLEAVDEPWIKKFMWPNRRILQRRKRFGRYIETIPVLKWWEYGELYRDKIKSPLLITFAFVATHNHFVLDRGGKVFKQSAPVIKLPEGAIEDDHVELLGVLNSSVACFWLKQNSHDKGSQGVNEGSKDESWEWFYEFTGTTLQNFPLPASFALDRAHRLDSLAQKLSRHTPRALAERRAPTRAALDSAYAKHQGIRAQMIAHQEELDWECYRLYGLMDEDLTYAGELSGISLGERAFEIMLARAMADGEDTAWFERHRSTPITEIPAHWPADYRALVQRRLDVIASNKNIRLLEKPEYKRRWAIEPWKKRVQAALKDWLLDKLEDRALWFDRQGRPRPRSVTQLADEVARDDEFRGVLELWAGRPDIPVADALRDLLADQAVPFLAAYRYKPSGLEKRKAWEHTWDLQRKEDAGELQLNPRTKLPDPPIPVPPKYKPADFIKTAYWQHRGKLDVPKERFILYPDAGRETDPTPLLGWAGWDHAQQALALATIMNEHEAEGWTDERMVPLIAGLAELQPWVRQWHGEIDPTYGVSLAAVIDEELASRAQRAGKTIEELAAWRPAAPRRGRCRTTAARQGNTA